MTTDGVPYLKLLYELATLSLNSSDAIKNLEQDLVTNLDIAKQDKKQDQNINCKMLNSIDNLIDMSLCLNIFTPKIQTKRQLSTPKLNSRPCFYIVKRRKLHRVFLNTILHAVNFHSLTGNYNYVEK